jgi:transcriptional regulator with XRE-family HTH domain
VRDSRVEIKEWRQRSGLTLSEAAKLAGVAVSHLHKLERQAAGYRVTMETAEKLSGPMRRDAMELYQGRELFERIERSLGIAPRRMGRPRKVA